MAVNQQAHQTGGGIGGKAKHDAKSAKKARREANLAHRADENRTRQKGSHEGPKAKKELGPSLGGGVPWQDRSH